MDQNIFICEACGKEYKSEKTLTTHKYKIHDIGNPPSFDNPNNDKTDKELAKKTKIHDEVKAKYKIFLSTLSTILGSHSSTKYDAIVINDNIELVSESVATAAESSTQVVEVVNKLVSSLSLLFLFATHGVLIQGIIANHTNSNLKKERDEVAKLREQLNKDDITNVGN